MAFKSNGPITVALPPFRGVTRRIILAAVVVYFALLLIGLYSRDLAALLSGFFMLEPSRAYLFVWQVFTYPFVNVGLFSLLFAALSVWFFGSSLEDEFGSRWFVEFFLASSVGGGIVACLLAFALNLRLPGIDTHELASGLWPFSISLLLAFAKFHADQELNFNFILRVKAKYIAAIYLLIYLAVALSSQRQFDAMLVLTNALCAWIFLQFAPRKGFGFAANEGIYGLRNAWVKSRRRRAAKKFSVYMQKQGREVHFDDSGRYVDPDKKDRDPNDRRWMN